MRTFNGKRKLRTSISRRIDSGALNRLLAFEIPRRL
jgi:hypothetical protein